MSLLVSQNYFDEIAKKESGLNINKLPLYSPQRYSKVNSYDYLGKYQMGTAALIEAGFYSGQVYKRNQIWDDSKWTDKARSFGINSRSDFLKSAAGQEAAIQEYTSKQWQQLKAFRLDEYVGKTVNDVYITVEGLLAGSHLKGVGSVRKFLKDGINLQDAYGTRVSDYLKIFESGEDKVINSFSVLVVKSGAFRIDEDGTIFVDLGRMEEFLDLGKDLKQYCFTCETPILMSDATYKPIEQIKIGDEVMAFDGLGKLRPRKVTQTFITLDQEVVQLGNIKVTLGHHFLQPDGSFKALSEIDKNGYLVGVTGKLIPHPGIKLVAGKHTVYNFTVEELHTYVAGDYRVHNESLSNYQSVTTAGIIGAAVGGQIGSFYAKDNFASQLIAQSLGNYTGGLVLDALAYQFDPALSQESLSVAAVYKRLPDSIISTGISLVTSKLINSVMKALKIEDPLAQAAISSLIHGSFTSALGSFIGTQLHQTMIQKWNILSEDFSPDGATIGSGIGGILGSFIPIPVIGTAIGSLLGGIIGGTFGDKDYPRAAYSVTIENGIFVAKFAFNLDGGSTSLAQQMGNNAKDILNFLASSVGGKLSPTGNIILDMYFYGHYLNSYFYKDLRVGADAAGGSSDWRYPNRFSNAQDAIIRGIIDQIKAAQFEGGDLYIKRLLKTLPTDVKTLDKLNADFQVAREWGIYKDNSVLYEKNINYLKANAIKDAETRILDLRSQSQSSVTPNPNYALKFDGVNDYLESASAIIPTQGTNNPFSVSVWAKIDPSIQNGLFELVSQGTGSNAFYIGGQNGKIRAGDTWINTGVDVPGDGLWHLFTVVRDNSNTHLYIDGQLKASKGSVIANPANTVFRVGRQYGDYWEIPKATIGEVSVWNTAISAAQVQGMTKDALTGSEGGLVAYWKLNEGIGSVAKDKSQFQRHLTIKEAEWASGIDPKVKDFNLNVLPSQVTLSLQTNDLIINGERFTNWVNAQNRLEILRFADGSRFKIVLNNGLVKLEDERVANWQQIQTRATQLNLNTPNSSDNFVNNNASRIVQGSDYALKFDGVNDYLESTSSIIPTSGTNNPFTVSVWAKIDPSIQKGLFELVSQGTGGNAFYIGGQNGKIRVGDTWLNSGVDVPGDGQWHLYTVVRTQTNTQVYIDGELKASKGSVIANPANTVFRIGRQYGGFWEVPKASIGEVSVWNTAISAAQVQGMTKQPLIGGEAGLVGYWQLKEGTGTVAKDKSQFQRHLTIKEAEWTARNVGGIGDDVLIPTASGQLLDGDKGDDIYRYNRGQGTITIKDAGGLDTIEFDASIQLSDLLIQQSGSNLIIALKDANNPIAAISTLPNKLILSDFATKKIELLRLGNNEEYLITPTGLIPNKPTTGANIPETFLGTYAANFLKVGTTVNGVLSFDGVNDSVQNPAKFADVKDTFTIEFWVNPTATRDSTPQNNYGVNNINQRYAIAPLNGALVLGSGNAYAGVSVGTNGISVFEHSSFTQNLKGSQTTVKYLPSLLVHDTTLSGWNHVAIVYNNKTPSLYLNGQFVKTGLPSTWIVHPSDVLGGFQYSQYEYLNYFQGFLDEVRIWNKAKTQTDIQADLNRPLIGNESGLVAYHNLNEATGTIVRDLTSYQNNGTIQGATRDIKALTRSDGNDTYLYSLGDTANVTIYDIGNYEGTIRDGGIDTLEFGAGITLNSLQLTLQTNNLIVKVNNTSTITIQDWVKSQSRIEIFRFADGKEYNPLLNFDGTFSLQAAFSPGNFNYNLATDKPATYSVSSNKLLVFDLGADGLQLISAEDSMTLFDVDNDAFPEQMGWVAPSDGFLVWDRNNDGLITSLTEFFSLQQQNQVGFLGAIDTNQDLVIDSKDSNFSQLRIWTDTNLNGEVELGELAALYRYGVNSISITPQTKNYNIAGNKITASAYFTRVGFETRSYSQLYDVAFTYNPNGAKLEQVSPGLSRFSYENKPDIIFADDSAPNINLIIDPVEVYSATGGKGNDALIVKSGSTQGAVLSGGDGNDKLVGADGNDILTGGAGIDSIDGGAGDDLITIDKNDNLNNIKGGLGFDVLVIEGDGDVSFTLDNLGVEVVNGNQGNNVFTAVGSQDVVISGGAGNDTITGGQGSDRLEGNEGNDSLNGGAGDDNLIGGLGDDYINGGDGNDTVILNGKSTEYKFDFSTLGSLKITDIKPNRDGQDTLVGCEFIRFSERDYRISELKDFEQFYRLVHKEVDNEVKAGLLNSGIQHYELYGKNEGRLTANDFNEQFYRLVNSDVDAAIKAGTISSAIFHYINWGFTEKRATNFQFNEAFYRLVHPSVDAAIKAGTMPSAIHHYINHGYAEGRVTNLSFDEQYYRSANSDVDAAIKAGTMPSAIHHYINHGYQEKRIAKFNAVNSNAALWGTANSDILQGANGNNLIVGFDGNDFLDGGTGNDSMNGGLGNDIYVVDSTGDVVTETSTLATEIDTVQSSISYTLGVNLENLTLTGSAAINGTGNSLNNTIRGNAANNILNVGVGNDSVFGMDGNDTISGAAGADTLTGGLGADRFVYFNFNDSLSLAPDRIIDLNPSQGDRIALTSLPTALFNAGIFSTATYSTLNAAAIAAYQDTNPNLTGTQPLAVNQAVFFGWNGGTYLSVNDSLAAFNPSGDLLINVTGIGTIATGSLTTNSFFSV